MTPEQNELIDYGKEQGLADLKAKYIKEGYESCLREVKARVGSIKEHSRSDLWYPKGWNDCLDEIKSLINEI